MKWNVDVVALKILCHKKNTLEKNIGQENPQNNFIPFKFQMVEEKEKMGYLMNDLRLYIKTIYI